jgi:hypothetical protein
VSTESAVFWVVAPCMTGVSLPTFQRSVLGDRPDDGGSCRRQQTKDTRERVHRSKQGLVRRPDEDKLRGTLRR